MSRPANLRRVALSNPHYGGFRVLLVLAALYTANGQTSSTPAIAPPPRPASALEVALTDNMSGVAANGANISSLPAQLYNFTSPSDAYTVPSNGLTVVGQGAYVGTAPPEPGASTAPFTFLQFTTADSPFSPFTVPNGKMPTHTHATQGDSPWCTPSATACVTAAPPMLCSCTTTPHCGPSRFTVLPSPASAHKHTNPPSAALLRFAQLSVLPTARMLRRYPGAAQPVAAAAPAAGQRCSQRRPVASAVRIPCGRQRACAAQGRHCLHGVTRVSAMTLPHWNMPSPQCCHAVIATDMRGIRCRSRPGPRRAMGKPQLKGG